jgi:threonine/homoserine/homoserine lactone efflux protein
VAFLNPKLAVFMLALFSQFLDPAFGFKEKSVMVATIGVTDALWCSLVAILVSQARFRRQVQPSARIVDAILGVMLIALALTVLFAALTSMQPSA